MVEVASTREVLQKRVYRLLRLDRASNKGGELESRILPFLKSLGDVALIGGAIRDLARAGREGFASDLDFVVHGSSHSGFHRVMQQNRAVPNRFGGFALSYGQWGAVDVWHLEDTWARTAGLRRVENLSDLLKCTFFDWDAVVFDVRTRRLTFEAGYLERLRLGIMELNLEENPNPAGSIVRALRRAALWNVRFGPKLTSFCIRQLESQTWEGLVARDRRVFGSPVLAFVDPEAVYRQLRTPTDVAGRMVSWPVPCWDRQLQLPLDRSEPTSLSPIGET